MNSTQKVNFETRRLSRETKQVKLVKPVPNKSGPSGTAAENVTGAWRNRIFGVRNRLRCFR